MKWVQNTSASFLLKGFDSMHLHCACTAIAMLRAVLPAASSVFIADKLPLEFDSTTNHLLVMAYWTNWNRSRIRLDSILLARPTSMNRILSGVEMSAETMSCKVLHPSIPCSTE